MTRTVVVLGSNAFSGQDLIDLLLDDPENKVIGISRSPESPEFMLRYKDRNDLSRYRFVQGDLNKDMEDILELLDKERPSHIVNFAAQSEVAPSWLHPDHYFRTNTVSLARLVNHLTEQDYLERYLHVSSPEVYGTCEGRVTEDEPFDPSTPYAASKASADLLLATYRQEEEFPLLTVRSTNVYGARQQLFKLIPRSAIYIKAGRTIPLHGGGRAVKSYIHVRDISRGERHILFDGEVGEIYHLSPEQGIPVREVVRLIAERLGADFEEVTRTVEERPGQDAKYVIDSSKARNKFGWEPEIEFEEGIDEVVRWVDEYWEKIQEQPLEYQHKP